MKPNMFSLMATTHSLNSTEIFFLLFFYLFIFIKHQSTSTSSTIFVYKTVTITPGEKTSREISCRQSQHNDVTYFPTQPSAPPA